MSTSSTSQHLAVNALVVFKVTAIPELSPETWLIILLRFPLKGDYNVKENILNEFLKFSVAGGCELAVRWKERGEAHRGSESDGKIQKKINDQNDPLRIFPIAVGGWEKKKITKNFLTSDSGFGPSETTHARFSQFTLHLYQASLFATICLRNTELLVSF